MNDKDKYVIRWRKGGTVPRVELAKQGDMDGYPSKRAAIESALRSARKRLDDARESVAANESYVALLEALLDKQPTP